MPRRTPSEINDEIIDIAAALFARQGRANTSLQQVADAAGYSKTGLLHRFASKDALFTAAMATTRGRVTEALAHALEMPAGSERDRRC